MGSCCSTRVIKEIQQPEQKKQEPLFENKQSLEGEKEISTQQPANEQTNKKSARKNPDYDIEEIQPPKFKLSKEEKNIEAEITQDNKDFSINMNVQMKKEETNKEVKYEDTIKVEKGVINQTENQQKEKPQKKIVTEAIPGQIESSRVADKKSEAINSKY